MDPMNFRKINLRKLQQRAMSQLPYHLQHESTSRIKIGNSDFLLFDKLENK